MAADDVAVISKHDTSTLANDPNETELHERLADALGRSEGAPLFVVSQKSLTGHAKGGAAVFQMMGLCQILRDGVIPPNRSLDCVDDELAGSAHFVWVRDTLRLGGKFPLKAGMLTSLGFGHVSGLVAPFSCREGHCGACACTLRAGKVNMGVNDVLEQQDLDEGLILACQSRPESDSVEVTYDE